MHVGYVLKKFPRISETFILREILELERQGAEVTIFSLHRPDDGIFHEKLARIRKPVVYLPVWKSQVSLGPLGKGLPMLRGRREEVWEVFETLCQAGRADLWTVLAWGFEVARAAKESGVDRLHAHFATVAANVARAAHAFSGLPFTFTCHAKDIYRQTVDARLFRFLAAPADFIVTVCEANRRHILGNLAGEDGLPVATLYNGVDLDEFHPRHRNKARPPLILGVGRLVEKKGFRFLVEAASGLAESGWDFRCLIVGEGEERIRLEEQIRSLGRDRISLAGIRTQEEVRELLREASMLVLPCIVGEDGNRDALPTVLLEALASGVPVVSSPVAGVEEIVDGGRSGLLVPMGDAGALREAMASLLEDPGRCETLALAGRKRAEQLFDLERNVGALLRWFHAGRAE